MTSTAGEEAALPQPAKAQQVASAATLEGSFRWPFCHYISKLSERVWDEVKVVLIGDTANGDSHREVVPEGDRFVAQRPLNKQSSVLESGTAQIRDMEQYALPKDVKMLREVPSVALHLALKSYLLRGAIIEHELFSRLSYAYELPTDFKKKLAEEKKAREKAEKRITALEAELCHNDGKWRRELKMKEDLIKGYKMHRAKQSASIEKLKGEMAKLKEGVDCLEKEVAERDARIRYLDEEVDLEKRHRLEAQEHARSEQLAADHAKLDFKEERAAHKETQATIQALEARVASLDSEVFKTKVIEEYRHSTLGKVEVALACKASFDYLASLLPSGS